MDDSVGHFTDRSVQSPKPTQVARDQPPKWSAWKYILRWIILTAALVATITSLVGIAAPVKESSWVFLNPLYPLPYVSRWSMLTALLFQNFFFFLFFFVSRQTTTGMTLSLVSQRQGKHVDKISIFSQS